MKVARLPVPGQSLLGEDLLLEAGGKGLNVAIAARRLGALVDGIVAIGSDSFAPMAVEALAKADLPEDMLVRFAGPSGTGVGLIDAHGENMIAVYPGANGLLSAREAKAAAARIAAAGAVIAQYEVGDEVITAAFAIARAAGVPTILNPSPYRPIRADILATTDMLVVNTTEAAALIAELAAPSTEGSGGFASLAHALFENGIETLVVTLGAEGALLWRRDGTHLRQPAFPVAAVDATGCGDAFLAGLVVALARTGDPQQALRIASACGAITCGRIGVIDALPDWTGAIALADPPRP
ncbi:MAG: ribokinase [Sphingomonas sp.]|nr:MAG: ribokinase [Sphingomonas sp.]